MRLPCLISSVTDVLVEKTLLLALGFDAFALVHVSG
jgi:hypothetical protein